MNLFCGKGSLNDQTHQIGLAYQEKKEMTTDDLKDSDLTGAEVVHHTREDVHLNPKTQMGAKTQSTQIAHLQIGRFTVSPA